MSALYLRETIDSTGFPGTFQDTAMIHKFYSGFSYPPNPLINNLQISAPLGLFSISSSDFAFSFITSSKTSIAVFHSFLVQRSGC